jgi:hypothetical protein
MVEKAAVVGGAALRHAGEMRAEAVVEAAIPFGRNPVVHIAGSSHTPR